MTEWDGKTALVTGGTRGIGRAIVESLASHGVAVTFTGRDSSAAEAVAKEIGSGVRGVAMDVTDREAIDGCVKAFLDAHGRIDMLINNAGITRDGLFMRMKGAD